MEEIKSPLKAIKAFCIDCCGGSYNEVLKCQSTICPLHAFRKGKNPYRSTAPKSLTEEQREAMRQHMQDMREKRSIKLAREVEDG